jgi:hypothetical protein
MSTTTSTSMVRRATIVTTAALVVAAGAGSALASTAAKPTSLTLKAAKTTVAPKAKDSLTGTLKSGSKTLGNEPVKLERRARGAKSFTMVSTKRTNGKGKVVYSVVPGTKKGQKEQYILVFPGNKAYKASHSSVITVSVN